MELEKLEEDRLRLTNAERVIFELFLFVYPITYIKVNWLFEAHYVWLGIAILTGALTFLVFSRKEYAPVLAVALSIVLAIPFFFIGMPFVVVVFLAIYSFWRIHDNFAVSKITGWPFHVLNPIVFLSFFLMTKPFFVNNDPGTLMHSQLILFAITTILYFIVRFIVVGRIGSRLNGFSVKELGKLYGGLLGIGLLTYIAVFFLLIPVRNALIAIVGFLFGGIFTFILKMFTPALDAFIALLDTKRAKMEDEKEQEIELGYSEFDMQEKIVIYGNNADMNTYILTSLMVIGLIILIMVLRKRKNLMSSDESSGILFRKFGKTAVQPTKRSVYDYSQADGKVRNAFKAFEELAQSSKAPRLQGETVKEWFSRMGWSNNSSLFTTYDKARYGKEAVSEKEGLAFVQELDKVKHDFFEKDV